MSEFSYRTCEVNGEEALFHCWEQWSEIIKPSILKGGHCDTCYTDTAVQIIKEELT